MKKFGDLRVGNLFVVIEYNRTNGGWEFTHTEYEIKNIDRRKRLFETAGFDLIVDSLRDTHIPMRYAVACPNSEENIVFAERMLRVGMEMKALQSQAKLNEFLGSIGICHGLK